MQEEAVLPDDLVAAIRVACDTILHDVVEQLFWSGPIHSWSVHNDATRVFGSTT